MKKFLSICLFVVLSILLTPVFSNQYNAVAGRVQAGNSLSPECDCNTSTGPCYEGTERCDPARSSQQATEQSTNSTAPVDGASIGLMLFVSAYLLRRFLL